MTIFIEKKSYSIRAAIRDDVDEISSLIRNFKPNTDGLAEDLKSVSDSSNNRELWVVAVNSSAKIVGAGYIKLRHSSETEADLFWSTNIPMFNLPSFLPKDLAAARILWFSGRLSGKVGKLFAYAYPSEYLPLGFRYVDEKAENKRVRMELDLPCSVPIF